ncbi:MAG: hypothetical protein GXO48_07820 [Chlorobi bacterium]|nr:hypothetical protein [Chlorobiota bacterium]
MGKRVLAIVLIGASFLGGCQILQALFKEAQPTVKFHKIKIDSVNVQNIHFRAYYKVSNPAQLSLQIPELTYEFITDGVKVTEGKLEKLRVRPDTAALVQVPFAVPWKNIYKVIRNLEGRDSFSYDLEGTVKVFVEKIGELSFPYSHSGRLPLLKIPKIHVGNIQVVSATLQNIRLRTTLQITNTNSFTFIIKKLKYAFQIGYLMPVEVFVRTNIEVSPDETEEIPVELDVDLGELGEAALSLINQRQLRYVFTGTFVVEVPDFAGYSGTLKFPFSDEGNIRLR